MDERREEEEQLGVARGGVLRRTKGASEPCEKNDGQLKNRTASRQKHFLIPSPPM